MAVRDTNDEDNKHKRTEQLTENNSLVLFNELKFLTVVKLDDFFTAQNLAKA